MNVLMIKFQLNLTLKEHKKGQYRIYIQADSMPQLRSIVFEHMDPSMLYKIKA
jgi:hypothetical protein